MVKPGGTGSFRLAISASPTPLPPSKLRIEAVPSARPSPKPYTHLPLDCGAAAFALGRTLGWKEFRTARFLRFTLVHARFLLTIGQATLVGRRHLKAPPHGPAQVRFRSAEKPQTEQ